MHRLRKTRLKKNMAHVFWDNLHKLLLLTPGYGNCRAVESVETNCMFSIVPAALGKLGTASSFPQFPQPLLLDIVMKKDGKTLHRRPNQNGVDKMRVKA